MYILFIVIAILGLLLLIDRRNFFIGALFAISIVTLIMTLLAIGLKVLINHMDDIPLLYWQIILSGIFIAIFLVILVVIPGMVFNTFFIAHKEGKGFTGKLSSILGVNNFLIIFVTLILITSNLPIFARALLSTFLLIDIFFSTLFIGYLIYSLIYQMIPKSFKVDYIVVLGAWVKDGKVTPLLKSRVDKAVGYYNKQQGHLKFIVSGGKGSDELISEGAAMKNYLLSINIPEKDIIVEDKSTTTLENMKFSKQKINEDWTSTTAPKILFSTSNYHVFRASLYAKKAGLNADGIGAPTSFYFLPSALIREYIAILVYYKYFTLLSLIVGIAIEFLAFWAH
ncbi:YdcF family protein [Dellaglioa sp. L3N]